MAGLLIIRRGLLFPSTAEGWELLQASVARELSPEETQALSSSESWHRIEEAGALELGEAIRAAAFEVARAERRLTEHRRDLAALQQAARLLADRHRFDPAAKLGDLVGEPIHQQAGGLQ